MYILIIKNETYCLNTGKIIHNRFHQCIDAILLNDWIRCDCKQLNGIQGGSVLWMDVTKSKINYTFI